MLQAARRRAYQHHRAQARLSDLIIYHFTTSGAARRLTSLRDGDGALAHCTEITTPSPPRCARSPPSHRMHAGARAAFDMREFWRARAARFSSAISATPQGLATGLVFSSISLERFLFVMRIPYFPDIPIPRSELQQSLPRHHSHTCRDIFGFYTFEC